GGERVARYSFIGSNPWMIVRGQRNRTIVEQNGTREEIANNAIDFVRAYFADKKLARRPGLAPLAGGAVGYLAYGAAGWFEPVLKSDAGETGDADDAVWMFFRNVVAFDRVRLQMEITSLRSEERRGGEEVRAEV